MTSIDHKSLAISRLATQFKESTNLINYIRALLLEANTLEGVFCDLLGKRWIETAEGVNLDILGSIVGQPRDYITSLVLDDDGYRVFILARISRNITDSSPESIISKIKFIFGSEVIVHILEGRNASYQISIGKLLSNNDNLVIYSDIIPKTAGVRVNYTSSFDPDDFFSFSGFPSGDGFGSLYTSDGGKFAKLI